MSNSELDVLKLNLVRAIRMLTYEEIMDFSGHMSCRIPGTDRVLINSRKSSRASLRLSDIVTIDLDGKLLEGEDEPPSERHIHTRIYIARPDVFSVAHLHPRVATVFSIAEKPLLPVFTTGVLFPLDGVPVYDDPALIHTREAGDGVAKSLGAATAVLLRGHGAVAVGSDIMNCFAASVWLEENAKKQWQAAVLGTPRVYSKDEYMRVSAGMCKPEVIKKTWDFYVNKALTFGTLEDKA